MRARPDCADIPVVVLTARDYARDRRRLQGASQILNKGEVSHAGARATGFTGWPSRQAWNPRRDSESLALSRTPIVEFKFVVQVLNTSHKRVVTVVPFPIGLPHAAYRSSLARDPRGPQPCSFPSAPLIAALRTRLDVDVRTASERWTVTNHLPPVSATSPPCSAPATAPRSSRACGGVRSRRSRSGPGRGCTRSSARPGGRDAACGSPDRARSRPCRA